MRPVPITKAEAVARFEESLEGVLDAGARNEAWNDYLDRLIREGQVSEARAARWSKPL